MDEKEEKKIRSREVVNNRVIISYEEGLVESIDKDRYYNSLDMKEKKKFISECF